MRGKQNTRKAVVVVLITLLTLLGGTASIGSAAPTAQGDLVAVTITPTQITWTPLIESSGIVLIISGPGSYLQETYGANTRITLPRADEAGNPRPDGVYSYAIQILPVDAGGERPDVNDEERGLVDVSAEEAKVYSGTFAVSGGYFVVPEEDETSGVDAARSRPGLDTATADILHYDDVIITGSLCVGFDCVNGESFGYCTQKYKENNLQVCFEDTSVGTFPTNDWKIQINDTTSGGASYFTIWDTDGGRRPFTIEAGAPAHSLYVEDYGRVGLGTSVPYVELHIVDGDSPTIRLDQDGSSGWTAQRWDLCGNETNFFIRDVTNGSKLTFRIQPNAPSNSLTIRSTGNVGIGTWSPEGALEIERTGENAKLVLQRTDGDKWVFNSAGGGLRIAANDPATAQVLIETDGDMTIQGSLTEVSDVNAKENFAAVDGRQVLAAVVEIPITTWNYKADELAVRHMGPMSQDFYAAYDLGADNKHIALKDIGGVALAAIQGLNEIVAEQDAQIEALEARVAELEETESSSNSETATSSLLPWILVGVLAGALLGTVACFLGLVTPLRKRLLDATQP
jgi:hypothetical protein